MEICFGHPEVLDSMQKNMHGELSGFLSDAGFHSFSCNYRQNLADDEKFLQTQKSVEFSARLGVKDFIIASVLGERGDEELWKLGLIRTKELLKTECSCNMCLLSPNPCMYYTGRGIGCGPVKSSAAAFTPI